MVQFLFPGTRRGCCAWISLGLAGLIAAAGAVCADGVQTAETTNNAQQWTVFRGTNSEVITQGAARPGVVTVDFSKPDEKTWSEKLKSVQVGMSRADVEKILPPRTEPEISIVTSGSYTMDYWLDNQWYVALTYEGTVSKDAGTNTLADSKLSQVPNLVRRNRR